MSSLRVLSHAPRTNALCKDCTQPQPENSSPLFRESFYRAIYLGFVRSILADQAVRWSSPRPRKRNTFSN